jgi:hypothetical protein
MACAIAPQQAKPKAAAAAARASLPVAGAMGLPPGAYSPAIPAFSLAAAMCLLRTAASQ